MKLSNTLRVERAKLKLTQEELAGKLNISRQTVHAIENSKYVPSVLLSLRIAKFFKRKFEDIFDLCDENED